MGICRICYQTGKHSPECPFSNIPPKRKMPVELRRLDYWLAGEDLRKRIQKDFEAGKYRYLGEGIFQEVGE